MNQREVLEEIARCLPRALARTLLQFSGDGVQEIRIRSGQLMAIHWAEGVKRTGPEPSPQQVQQIAEALCEHALYARAEEQRSGFVTLRGGHRMGLCGRVILQGQSVRALREISSLCIRVAGQWHGAADRLLPLVMDDAGILHNTLILGLPGTGKTTMLRDACLRLSQAGFRVGVVDERSEIAAMSGGEAQLAVGPNTDVLDGCCKEAGLRWMLRSMSPDVLITDELGSPGDVQAVLDAAAAGVCMVGTLHSGRPEPPPSRGLLAQLSFQNAFEHYVWLDAGQTGRLAQVYDRHLQPVPLL